MTFASEIEAFTPPQPNRETVQAVSPSVLSPTTPRHHQHQFSISSANGVVEVSTVQPVSLRQSRGARLSFFGGRKREPQSGQLVSGGSTINEEGGLQSPGISQDQYRANVSHIQAQENQPPPSHGTNNSSVSNGVILKSVSEGSGDWVTDSGGGSRASYDTHILSASFIDSAANERKDSLIGGAAPLKLGGVKKRLSLLKLGKKSTKNNGMMGPVSEE